MRIIYYVIVVLSMFLLISCSGKQEKQQKELPYIIDFEQCISNARNVKISDIADSIELVELKTPEELPVSVIWKFMPVDNYWFIHAREGIFKFTDKGEFINQFGRRGQGPGEYTAVYEVSVNKHRKELLINTVGRLLYYDWDGNFLRSEKKGLPMLASDFSDSILWGAEWGRNTDKYILYGLNEQWDTVHTVTNPFYNMISQDGGLGAVMMELGKSFYHYQDALYLNGPLDNDTIYQLKGDNCIPYAVFNMGKYKLPLEYMIWYNREANLKHASNYWAIPLISESERYLFVKAQRQARDEDGYRYIMYDKQNREGFLVNEEKDQTITDDILDGPDIWPIWTTDTHYVGMVNPYTYQEEIKDKNLQLSSQLQKVIDTWNHDTNVILMLCRKKKIN